MTVIANVNQNLKDRTLRWFDDVLDQVDDGSDEGENARQITEQTMDRVFNNSDIIANFVVATAIKRILRKSGISSDIRKEGNTLVKLWSNQ